jgi:hypothetical protein
LLLDIAGTIFMLINLLGNALSILGTVLSLPTTEEIFPATDWTLEN